MASEIWGVWNGSISFFNLVDYFLENWHFSLSYNIDCKAATSEMVLFNKMNYQNYKLGSTMLKFAYSGLQAMSDKTAFHCSALSCHHLVFLCLIYYSNSILLLLSFPLHRYFSNYTQFHCKHLSIKQQILRGSQRWTYEKSLKPILVPKSANMNSCRVIQPIQSRVELKYFILEKWFHFLNNSLLSLGEDITSNSFHPDEAAHLQVCSATYLCEVSLSTCYTELLIWDVHKGLN